MARLLCHGAWGHICGPRSYALRLKNAGLKGLLSDIDEMVTASARFDLAVSNRWFQMGISDFLTTIIGMYLTKRLGSIAQMLR